MQAISNNSSLLCKLSYSCLNYFFSQLIVLLLLPTHLDTPVCHWGTIWPLYLPHGYFFFPHGIQTTRQQRDHTSPCSHTTQLQMIRRVRQTAGW